MANLPPFNSATPFVASGGTTSRALQDRYFLDLVDYGLTGSGNQAAADTNRLAFDTALMNLRNLGRGLLIIPEGYWYFSDPNNTGGVLCLNGYVDQSLATDVTIVGMGVKTIISQTDHSTATGYQIVGFYRALRCGVRDLVVDGNRSGQLMQTINGVTTPVSRTHGLRVDGAYLNFSNIWARNTTSYGWGLAQPGGHQGQAYLRHSRFCQLTISHVGDDCLDEKNSNNSNVGNIAEDILLSDWDNNLVGGNTGFDQRGGFASVRNIRAVNYTGLNAAIRFRQGDVGRNNQEGIYNGIGGHQGIFDGFFIDAMAPGLPGDRPVDYTPRPTGHVGIDYVARSCIGMNGFIKNCGNAVHIVERDAVAENIRILDAAQRPIQIATSNDLTTYRGDRARVTNCTIEISATNNMPTDIAGSCASFSYLAGVLTVVTAAPHGLVVGSTVPFNLVGQTPNSLIAAYSATVIDASTLTMPLAADPGQVTILGTYFVNVQTTTGDGIMVGADDAKIENLTVIGVAGYGANILTGANRTQITGGSFEGNASGRVLDNGNDTTIVMPRSTRGALQQAAPRGTIVACVGGRYADINDYASAASGASYITSSSRGPVHWANRILGNRFTFQSYEDNGANIAALYNRSLSGLNFGCTNFTSDKWRRMITANVLPTAPDVLVICPDQIDVINGRSLSQITGDYAATVRIVRATGTVVLVCTIPPVSVSVAAAGSVNRKRLNYLNTYIRSTLALQDGVLLADIHAAMVDPTSANGEPLAGMMSSNDMTKVGGYTAGQVIANALDRILPPSGRTLFASRDDLYDATDNPLGNILANGNLTNGGGVASTAVTGTVASGWTVKRTATSGVTTCAASLVVDPTYGPMQQLVITLPGGGTGTETFQFYQSSVDLQAFASAWVRAGATLIVPATTWMYRNDIVLQDSTTAFSATGNGSWSSTDPDPNVAIQGVLLTPPMLVTASPPIAEPHRIQYSIGLDATQTGSLTVRIGRLFIKPSIDPTTLIAAPVAF